MMSVEPQNAFSAQLHAEKYREPNESFREAMGRVAGALKDGDTHYHEFRDTLLDMRFLPAGRVQAAMGASKRVTPYNCFVSGPIEDSFVAGAGSIMNRAKQAATTMRMGGGIGYDFSTLRPRGALIRKLNSQSTGPLGFMPIFDAICQATSSCGNRRGAQMGVLRIDHPDIAEYIRAKQPGGKVQALWDVVEQMLEGPQRAAAALALQNTLALQGFNLSVAITDEFMEALAKGSTYKLRFQNRIVGEADASTIWEMLMRSTWDWAEPGVLFIDTINRMNPLSYCERIAATNPCFTGDTKVWTAGGQKTFADLAQSGRDVEVLTQGSDGKLVYRMMRRPRVTRRMAKLVRVTFDDRTSVRCTPSHEFFLRDDTRVRADNLAAGMSIQSIHSRGWNHKVVSVETLDEEEDVYCGTVDETGRFFIALGEDDGILVSNCGEQPLPPSVHASSGRSTL